MNSAFFDEMSKLAADEKKSPGMSIAKILASGLVGFGLGTAGGITAGHLADAISKKTTGKPIPHSVLYAALPMLGAAGGMAYSVHKAREREAIQRALKDSTNNGTR